MKVLFVGDGKHDVGAGDGTANVPFVAAGTLPPLCRKVIPHIAHDSVALRWADIVRFQSTKRGYEAKARAARLIAERRVDRCEGLILVVDNDGDTKGERLQKLATAKGESLPVACGVAVESIEAWTLGAVSALAEVLNVSEADIRKAIGPRPVEDLKSGSPRSAKQALRETAELGNREPDTLFRQQVAELTNIAELEKACPEGFAPLVEDLRQVFQH